MNSLFMTFFKNSYIRHDTKSDIKESMYTYLISMFNHNMKESNVDNYRLNMEKIRFKFPKIGYIHIVSVIKMWDIPYFIRVFLTYNQIKKAFSNMDISLQYRANWIFTYCFWIFLGQCTHPSF